MGTRIWAGMLIGMISWATHAGGVVILDDVEWRQPAETTNCTWNEVAAACPQNGTPCSGHVTRASDQSTVDVAGWTWARTPEVRALFERIIQPGTVNFPNDGVFFGNVDDPDIHQAVTGAPCWFQPTYVQSAYGDYYRYLYGWSATTYGSNNAFVPYMIDYTAGQEDVARLNTIQSRTYRDFQGILPLGVWLYRPLVSRTRMVLALPDVNADGTADIAVMRDQPIRAEVRSGADNALLGTVPFLESFAGTPFLPVDAEVVGDADGNGVPEIALLVRRYSDARGMVELRNVTGAAAARQVWATACHKPLALAVIADDADGNGVPELAVLLTRNRDGRGVVEVKNAYGATNPVSIWSPSGYTPSDVEVVPDADGNGVPEVAVLEARDTDGRMVVEVKNASGPTNPNSVWFMAGNSPIDLAVVGDKDGNGVPEVAVLSSRDSDGRVVVEVKNADGATGPSSVWFMQGQAGLAVKSVGDADANGVPDIAVLSTRLSDGRVLVEVKNAAGATNGRALWYPAGYGARDIAVLPDLDGSGVAEAGVLLIRNSDGRIVVQRRNAAGTQAPVDYWFLP
jgi:hypothetical protein